MGSYLAYVGLISFRLLPLFVVAPISSFRRVPMLVRIILTIALASAFATGSSSHSIEIAWSSLSGAMLLSEFLIGASLAFSFHAAHAAMQTMGSLIDLQVGFAAGAVFDPSTEQMTSPVGEIMTMLLMILLIVLNVHHDLLVGFSSLLNVLPPGASVLWSAQWLTILASHFTLGFIIVSPIVLALWLVDATLSFISRSLPQAQIYFVGLPVKVGLGILLLSWFASHAAEPMHRILMHSIDSWNIMFRV